MENNTLNHHGVKGMRWGFRRYQNKDGTLTRAGKKRQAKNLEKARAAAKAKRDEKKQAEETRAKLLKSTNAKELYENRNLLTTAEINERLNRIDTERRLGQVAESTKKSGMDFVDKALKIGRKVNEVYEFTNTPVMKALKKQLGIEKAEKRLGLDEIYKKRDSLTSNQLSEALKRANTEKAIKRILDENAADRLADAQRQVNEYNAKLAKQAVPSRNSTYSKKGKDLVDPVLETNRRVSDVDNKTLMLGQTYVAGLLEDKSR